MKEPMIPLGQRGLVRLSKLQETLEKNPITKEELKEAEEYTEKISKSTIGKILKFKPYKSKIEGGVEK